jgi:hypothetical protein
MFVQGSLGQPQGLHRDRYWRAVHARGR